MNDELYLVACDGCQSYGVEMYLVGIFTSLEKAQNAAVQVNLYINTCLKDKFGADNHQSKNYCRIITAEKDITYPMKSSNWDDFLNDKYIGGYVE